MKGARVDFGVSIPTCREGLSLPLPYADIEDCVRMAQLAEQLGYDSAWGNDHITAPTYVQEAYDDPPRFFEPLVTLAYVAAHTTRIKLGTAVLVVPMRDPVFLAKQVSTLDQASGGRFLLGVGVGAYREELQAIRPSVGKPNRGDMLEEGLAALRLLLDERKGSMEGRFWSFRDIEIYPKAVQTPFPIYVGGNHPNQISRTVKFGQAWFPASIPPEMIATGRVELLRQAEEAGRDGASIRVAPQVIVSIRRTSQEAQANFERSEMFRHFNTLLDSTLRNVQLQKATDAGLIGSPEEIVERVGQFEEAGADMMASMTFVSPTFEQTLEDIQMFAEEVFPAFHRSPTAASA
ncbi:MAG: LLM class flavin-dependent oxidoreductase [Actinomycetota bacterium]